MEDMAVTVARFTTLGHPTGATSPSDICTMSLTEDGSLSHTVAVPFNVHTAAQCVVEDFLYISSGRMAKNREFLTQKGITVIVNGTTSLHPVQSFFKEGDEEEDEEEEEEDSSL